MTDVVEAQRRIVEEMAGLEDHLARYGFLVARGRALESPPDIRKEEFLVPGCQSQVWIRARLEDGRLRIEADSDAWITRGIISLLVEALDGHAPEEVRDAELFFLDETGLSAHLSPSRANGLAAMVARIRELAAEASGGAS